MDIVSLIIQLISGAVAAAWPAGSAWARPAIRRRILGGGLGGQLLNMLGVGGGAAAGGLDIGSIVSSIAGGGVGGAVLMVIIGIIRGLMGRSS
jgi:hypothetical protein